MDRQPSPFNLNPVDNKFFKKNKIRKKIFLTTFIFFIFHTTLLSAKDDRIPLALAPIINETQMAYIDSLGDTVVENILFTGDMISRIDMVDRSGEQLLSPQDKFTLKRIAKNAKCRYLISGSISRTDTGYTLSLFLYNRDTGEIQTTKTGNFSRATDIFDISDRLSLSLFEEVIGEQIKKGEIYFINKTPGGSFLVTINGKELEENVPYISLVEGEYTVQIFNTTGNSKKRILKEKVEVKEGKPQRLSFDLEGKTSKPNRFNKKNTIRAGLGIGGLISDERVSSSNGTLLTGWIADLPAIYYSRLFTDKAGLTVGASLVPGLSFQNVGFKVKVGPYFRPGRLGFSPMLGFGFVYSSTEGHSFEEFQSNASLPAEGDDYLICWGELMLLMDIFFTPGFSMYAELGFTVGYIEEHSGGNEITDAGSFSGIGMGLTIGLGLGISF